MSQYNLRANPAPSQRKGGLFGPLGPEAAASMVASNLFPGGANYKTQKQREADARVKCGAKGRGGAGARGGGRGKVAKQRQQTPRRSHTSQSSLPIPPTDNRNQGQDDLSEHSDGLQPIENEPPASHQQPRRLFGEEEEESEGQSQEEELQQDTQQDTQQQTQQQTQPQSRPQSQQHRQQSTPRRQTELLHPTKGPVGSPALPDTAADVRAAIEIVTGSKNTVIAGWRQRIDSIDLMSLDTRAQEELRQHALSLSRPGIVVRTSLVPPIAALSARGLKTAKLSMASEDAFELVKEDIDELLNEGKGESLRVTITIRATITSAKQVATQPVNAEMSGALPADAPPQRREKESTNKRQHRQIATHEIMEAATNQHILELNARYQCKDTACPNYNFRCFTILKVGHLALTNPDLVAWNEAIVARRTTVAMPPPDVVANILNRKAQARGKKARASPPKESLPIGHGTMNFYLGGAAVPAQSSILNIRSSPPVCEGSEIDNLRAYLLWLMENDHLSDENFRTANLALQRAGWGFQYLKTIEDDEWKEMNIPRGAKVMILGRQKEFRDLRIAQAVREETVRRLAAEQAQGDVGNVADIDEFNLDEN